MFRRPKESQADFEARRYRWISWNRREPNVDLYNVSDTEVAEYRAWAGAKAFHEKRVDELIAFAAERNEIR